MYSMELEVKKMPAEKSREKTPLASEVTRYFLGRQWGFCRVCWKR